LYENGNAYHYLGTGFSVNKGTISTVERVEFVGDRISCLILKGSWCYIIVLNVSVTAEDESDDVKNSFYEEL
jgi:hypothetical protein